MHLHHIWFESNSDRIVGPSPAVLNCANPHANGRKSSRDGIPVEHPGRESFPSRWRCIAGLSGLYAFALRLPDPCTFVVSKLGITLNEENTAVEMFRKCHGSQQTA